MSEHTRKLPYEKFPIYIEFSSELVLDETISTKTVTCINTKDNSDSKATIVASESTSGGKVTIIIQNGILGEIHKITTIVRTSLDNYFEKDVFLSIKDDEEEDFFFKQSSEQFSVANDFKGELISGDSVATHVVSATRLKDGVDVTNDIIEGSGLHVSKIHLHAGVFLGLDGEYYQLAMQVVTALGYKYQKNVTLILKEV